MAATLATSEWGGGGGTTQGVNTPTGIQVSDVIIVYIASHGAGSTQTWTPVNSGYTALQNSGTSAGGVDFSQQTFWKVATQDDVDAPTITFSGSLGGGYQLCVAVCVRGGNITQAPTYVTGTVTANSTVTTAGLTPPAADSLLVMISNICDNDAVTQSQASYAITTSNPSWTEGLDVCPTPYTLGLAYAYAARPEATATSTSTSVATLNTGTADTYFQILLAVGPTVDYTMTATGTSYALTMGEATLSYYNPDVLNTSKPTTTLNNTPKP